MSHPQQQHAAPWTVAKTGQGAESVQSEDYSKMRAMCDRLTSGELMKDLAPEFFGSASSLFRRMDRYPELRRMYDAARVLQAHHFAEESLTCIDSEPDAQRAKLKSEVRRWLASKLNPRDYSERMELNVSGSLNVLAAMSDATRGSLLSLPPVIEAEVIPNDPDPEERLPGQLC